ncbi:MAG: hypothetical protein JWP66_229 [Naasia sp.]|nr:hypothetical protein [Naasia sp.]
MSPQKPTNRPTGAPVWIELLSTDPEEAARFYTAALGAEVTEPKAEFGGYRDVMHDRKVMAGLIREKEKSRSGWRLWLVSHDLDATVAAVTAHGGDMLEGPDEVEGLGRRAIVRDPSGAETGVWQLAGFPGIEVEDVPGAPCWYELHTTRAYQETVDFYRDAFDWDVRVLSDTDDFRMATFGEDEEALAGIFDASGGSDGSASDAPSRWQIYFAVEDADAAVEAATSNGGLLLGEIEDTEFGRTAHLEDSTGAAFCIIKLPGVGTRAG